MTARVEVRDHTIWVKHLIDAPQIRERIEALPPDSPLALIVDGKPLLFRKMKNGSDGRPTAGIRPDESFKAYWNTLYNERRGERVSVALTDAKLADPYLQSIAHLLSEWDSAADNAAYNDL
jgi:hypothetical protein